VGYDVFFNKDWISHEEDDCSVSFAAAAFAKEHRGRYAWRGLVQLFNGRDLSGWVEVGKEKWTVENGAIRARPSARLMGISRRRRATRILSCFTVQGQAAEIPASFFTSVSSLVHRM